VQLAAQNNSTWQWAKRGGSYGSNSTNNSVVAMATDQYGNAYIVAADAGNLDIDGHTDTNSLTGYSLSSWDCSGNFRWMKLFGHQH